MFKFMGNSVNPLTSMKLETLPIPSDMHLIGAVIVKSLY